VGQRADRDGGQVQRERIPRGRGLGGTGAGGQDGADVGGAPAAERDRPVEAARNCSSPWAARRVFSSASSGPSRVFPAAAAPVMNTSAAGPSAQNSFSAAVLGRTARRGVAGRGPP
jgi:hypothetical protein